MARNIELIDIFFLRNRLRRWTGTEQEIDRTNRLFPLYSLNGLRSAWALGDRLRRGMYLHKMIIRVSCAELEMCPFAGAGWPDSQAFGRPRTRLRTLLGQMHKRATRRPSPQTPQRANQLRQARLSNETKQLLVSCLADNPTNPVFALFDRKRTSKR